jgi:hypothetical protein
MHVLLKEVHMTAATRPEVIEAVKYEWAFSPWVNTRQIGKRFQDKYGRNLVRDRRIADIIAEAREAAPDTPFPCTLWHPWDELEANPAATLFVVRLHQQAHREGGEGLRCHEAAWAKRLRLALEGLERAHPDVEPEQEDREQKDVEKMWRVLEVVTSYAQRERTAYYLNAPIRSEDLDGFVTFGMWRSPEHQQHYEEAITEKLIPIPFLGASEAFMKELVARGPRGLGEEVWDNLLHHPIFAHTFKFLADPSESLPAGWSSIILRFLDDPTGYSAILNHSTSAATTAAHS